MIGAATRAGSVRDDSGAGSVLVLIGVGALVLAISVVVAFAGAQAARQRASAAADLAALAAAAHLAGAGDPCAAARPVADRNGARLVTCVLEPGSATVAVTVEASLPAALERLGLGPARARARAGSASGSAVLDLKIGSTPG